MLQHVLGDFYMIKIGMKAPANILIEDTESGIDLLVQIEIRLSKG